jgi:hypothetical protein
MANTHFEMLNLYWSIKTVSIYRNYCENAKHFLSYYYQNTEIPKFPSLIFTFIISNNKHFGIRP